MAASPHISNQLSNLAAILPILRPVRSGVKDVWIDIGLEVFDPHSFSPFMVALSMAARDDIKIACALAGSLTREMGAKAEQAVYVMGTTDPNVSKIGIAGDPAKRLKNLQTANWSGLKISGLLWSYYSARQIEQRALKSAAKSGKRLNGEWVAMSPDEAMLLIAECAEQLSSKVADSGMWVRNRNRICIAGTAFRQAMFDQSSSTRQGIRTQRYDSTAASQHSQLV